MDMRRQVSSECSKGPRDLRPALLGILRSGEYREGLFDRLGWLLLRKQR